MLYADMDLTISSLTRGHRQQVGMSPASKTSIFTSRFSLWLPLRLLKLCKYLFCLALLLIVIRIFFFIYLPDKTKVIAIEHHHSIEINAIMKLFTLPESFISARGAYCLDGSPPGYYYRPSQDKSVKSWVIYLPGGAWCTSNDDCYNRSKTALGSSRMAPSTMSYDGFLSSSCRKNPNFCFWNVLILHYCDGGSFLGNVSGVVQYQSQSLYLRGAPIFEALFEYILTVTHMGQAEQIVLAGSSAGGIGALIHVDRLHRVLPKCVKTVRVVVDGSMFADVPSISGHKIAAEMFESVYSIHNLKSSLGAQRCIKEQSPGKEWRCLLPEVYHYYVDAPAFFINSVHDTWQRTNILKVPCFAVNCPNAHSDTVYRLKESIRHMARQIIRSRKNSVFLTSCPLHMIMIKPFFSKLEIVSPTLQSSLVSWMQKDMTQTYLDTVVGLEAALEQCQAVLFLPT